MGGWPARSSAFKMKYYTENETLEITAIGVFSGTTDLLWFNWCLTSLNHDEIRKRWSGSRNCVGLSNLVWVRTLWALFRDLELRKTVCCLGRWLYCYGVLIGLLLSEFGTEVQYMVLCGVLETFWKGLECIGSPFLHCSGQGPFLK